MKRRTFLRAAAAVIPAAGLHDLLEGQAQGQVAVSPRAPELHVVGAGRRPLRAISLAGDKSSAV
jgi:hypothetical protein